MTKFKMPQVKMPQIKLPANIARIFNFGKKAANVIGVDIGACTLKIVGVRLAQEVEIAFYSIIEIPTGSDNDYITDTIKKTVKANSFSSQSAVLTFSDEAIAIRRIEMPHMPYGEVIEALRWKAKDLVHFDISSAAIGFQVIGEVQKEDGSKAFDIMFVAVSSEVIEKKIKAVKDANLSVEAVSVEPFGLEAILKMGPKQEHPKTTLIVDAGNMKTEVSMFRNGTLEFVRPIPLGSGVISDALQSKFLSDKGEEIVLTKEQADDAKKRLGIAYDAVTLENGISSRQILSLMRPVLERISKEIKRSEEYYVHEFGVENISEAYLAGGGAGLKNLDRYLQEELNVPVAKIAMPPSINTSKVALNADDAMSIAALVGVAVSYRKCLNLLPHEYRTEKVEFIEKVSLRALASILVVALWVSFFFTKVRIDDYDRRIKTAPIQQEVVAQVKELRNRAVEREAFLSSLQAGELPVENIMKELSNIIPQNVVLQNLTMNKKAKTVNMSGFVYGPGSSAQTILAKFMEDMESSRYFKEAQLDSLQLGKAGSQDSSTFSMACSLE
ncbi:MAG: pilus assembly protein PilM [Candidatus Omnitrophota bacterium]|nr:pilus assembly protein PilM [Candidatus Omnitrophota bacterium]